MSEITQAEIDRLNHLLAKHVQTAPGRITVEASLAVTAMYSALVNAAQYDHDERAIRGIRTAVAHLEAAEAKAAEHG